MSLLCLRSYKPFCLPSSPLVTCCLILEHQKLRKRKDKINIVEFLSLNASTFLVGV